MRKGSCDAILAKMRSGVEYHRAAYYVLIDDGGRDTLRPSTTAETSRCISRALQMASSCLSGAIIALLLCGASGQAAVNTWTGVANDNWNMAGNWMTTNPGGVPVDGDSLVFTGTTPNNATDNDISDLLVTDITFDASAAAYTLAGDRLNLGWQTVPPPTGTGITYTGDIVNNSTNTQTINLPLTLDPAKHVISTGTGRLNLHGPITQSEGLDSDLLQRRRRH